jgi:dUTP pyrophosphatase
MNRRYRNNPASVVIFVIKSSLEIKIINRTPDPLHEKAISGYSGMDIRANPGKPGTLKSLGRKLISRGLFIEFPKGYEALICTRSGMAIRQVISCLNSPGSVESN